MNTATLEQETEARAIEDFQRTCLRRISSLPGDREAHNDILDLYLETRRRLENGWTLKSVLTNALIHLSRI